MFIRQLLIFVAAASAMVPVASVIAQPITASAPGTKFSFGITDRWKKETGRYEIEVTKRSGDITTVMETGFTGEVTYTISESGEITRPKPGTGEVWTYKAVPFPLVENAEWDWVFYYVSPTQGILSQTSRKCKALGIEEITVAAGKFSTRKYECKGSWASGTFSGINRRKAWFSPELNVVVRVEEETSGAYGTELLVTQLLSITRP